MKTVTTTFGASFKINQGESILDAASSHGFSLPYSCRTGRCSTCKCKLVAGESSTIHDELGLSEQEKSKGWILSCARSASTDLVLEIEDLSKVALATPKTVPCRISALELVTHDVLKITVRLPPSVIFSFLPGQYIDLINPQGYRRSYSIANADGEKGLIELHVRAVSNGLMSQYWFHQAKINDLLRFHGPLGTFFLRELADLDLIFLATGTGIAPVQAMLESLDLLSTEAQPRSTTVYWGNRYEDDVYLELKSTLTRFQYIPVLSRAGEQWLGARGYVQDNVLSDTPDLSKSVVYACGSETMIHSAKDLLFLHGLPENRFFSDAFVCSSS